MIKWYIKKIISKGDYNYALVPEHPKATKNGYVLEHRIVMENHLGRLLTNDEIVHHKNDNKKDNRIVNLTIMSKSEHASYHQKLKYPNGRTFVKFICPHCSVNFEREVRNTHNRKLVFCSRKCSATYYYNQESQFCKRPRTNHAF